MKVLVATRYAKEIKETDFCYASDGELVFKHERCNSDDHPSACRCPISLAGMRTKSITNLVRVEERECFIDEVDAMHPSMPDMREIASRYVPGTVLEIVPGGFLLRHGEDVWDDIIDV